MTIEKEPTKLNLYQKISAVMNEIDYLQKDDKISFNKTNYKAISEEKVTSTVRAALIKYGLVILPIEQEHSREGTLSIVNTKYKIVDTDTGQHEIIVSSGTGVDTQDKGVGKAMTYSYKYLLLRTFAIPTGEDPDKISNEEIESKGKRKQEEQQNNDQQTSAGNKPLITAGQLKYLNTLVTRMDKELGHNRETVKETLRKKPGIGHFDSVKDLTVGQASKAIETLQAALGGQ